MPMLTPPADDPLPLCTTHLPAAPSVARPTTRSLSPSTDSQSGSSSSDRPPPLTAYPLSSSVGAAAHDAVDRELKRANRSQIIQSTPITKRKKSEDGSQPSIKTVENIKNVQAATNSIRPTPTPLPTASLPNMRLPPFELAPIQPASFLGRPSSIEPLAFIPHPGFTLASRPPITTSGVPTTQHAEAPFSQPFTLVISPPLESTPTGPTSVPVVRPAERSPSALLLPATAMSANERPVYREYQFKPGPQLDSHQRPETAATPAPKPSAAAKVSARPAIPAYVPRVRPRPSSPPPTPVSASLSAPIKPPPLPTPPTMTKSDSRRHLVAGRAMEIVSYRMEQDARANNSVNVDDMNLVRQSSPGTASGWTVAAEDSMKAKDSMTSTPKVMDPCSKPGRQVSTADPRIRPSLPRNDSSTVQLLNTPTVQIPPPPKDLTFITPPVVNVGKDSEASHQASKESGPPSRPSGTTAKGPSQTVIPRSSDGTGDVAGGVNKAAGTNAPAPPVETARSRDGGGGNSSRAESVDPNQQTSTPLPPTQERLVPKRKEIPTIDSSSETASVQTTPVVPSSASASRTPSTTGKSSAKQPTKKPSSTSPLAAIVSTQPDGDVTSSAATSSTPATTAASTTPVKPSQTASTTTSLSSVYVRRIKKEMIPADCWDPERQQEARKAYDQQTRERSAVVGKLVHKLIWDDRGIILHWREAPPPPKPVSKPKTSPMVALLSKRSPSKTRSATPKPASQATATSASEGASPSDAAATTTSNKPTSTPGSGSTVKAPSKSQPRIEEIGVAMAKRASAAKLDKAGNAKTGTRPAQTTAKPLPKPSQSVQKPALNVVPPPFARPSTLSTQQPRSLDHGDEEDQINGPSSVRADVVIAHHDDEEDTINGPVDMEEDVFIPQPVFEDEYSYEPHGVERRVNTRPNGQEDGVDKEAANEDVSQPQKDDGKASMETTEQMVSADVATSEVDPVDTTMEVDIEVRSGELEAGSDEDGATMEIDEAVPIEGVAVEPLPVESSPFEPLSVESLRVQPTIDRPAPVDPIPLERVSIKPVQTYLGGIQSISVKPAPAKPAAVSPTPIGPKAVSAMEIEIETDDVTWGKGASDPGPQEVDSRDHQASDAMDVDVPDPVTSADVEIEHVAEGECEDNGDHERKQQSKEKVGETSEFEVLDSTMSVHVEAGGLEENGVENGVQDGVEDEVKDVMEDVVEDDMRDEIEDESKDGLEDELGDGLGNWFDNGTEGEGNPEADQEQDATRKDDPIENPANTLIDMPDDDADSAPQECAIPITPADDYTSATRKGDGIDTTPAEEDTKKEADTARPDNTFTTIAAEADDSGVAGLEDWSEHEDEDERFTMHRPRTRSMAKPVTVPRSPSPSENEDDSDYDEDEYEDEGDEDEVEEEDERGSDFDSLYEERGGKRATAGSGVVGERDDEEKTELSAGGAGDDIRGTSTVDDERPLREIRPARRARKTSNSAHSSSTLTQLTPSPTTTSAMANSLSLASTSTASTVPIASHVPAQQSKKRGRPRGAPQYAASVRIPSAYKHLYTNEQRMAKKACKAFIERETAKWEDKLNLSLRPSWNSQSMLLYFYPRKGWALEPIAKPLVETEREPERDEQVDSEEEEEEEGKVRKRKRRRVQKLVLSDEELEPEPQPEPQTEPEREPEPVKPPKRKPRRPRKLARVSPGPSTKPSLKPSSRPSPEPSSKSLPQLLPESPARRQSTKTKSPTVQPEPTVDFPAPTFSRFDSRKLRDPTPVTEWDSASSEGGDNLEDEDKDEKPDTNRPASLDPIALTGRSHSPLSSTPIRNDSFDAPSTSTSTANDYSQHISPFSMNTTYITTTTAQRMNSIKRELEEKLGKLDRWEKLVKTLPHQSEVLQGRIEATEKAMFALQDELAALETRLIG